jgi:glutamine synthetase
MRIPVEYIWVDGAIPTKKLRSKIKIVDVEDRTNVSLSDMPDWGFDGSSTGQAEGNFSDCKLVPVRVYNHQYGHIPLVLCEVWNADGVTGHETNTRWDLRELQEKLIDQDVWVGLEQEYTLFQGQRPLGWPEGGYPPPQGPFYCGVGADEAFGRQLVEEHMYQCINYGISLSGINAEVMPGQWEFQVGAGDPLKISDDLIVARYLLFKHGEVDNINVSLDPKPVRGDWNGAGCHVNFSTKSMREDGGIEAVFEACDRLGDKHKEHIAVYGHGNEARLTGLHETCSINEFRYGISDRGASIRIPMDTANNGRGYLEDRRPAANCDPYEVCHILMETICK